MDKTDKILENGAPLLVDYDLDEDSDSDFGDESPVTITNCDFFGLEDEDEELMCNIFSDDQESSKHYQHAFKQKLADGNPPTDEIPTPQSTNQLVRTCLPPPSKNQKNHHQPDASANQKVTDTDQTTHDNQLVSSCLPPPEKLRKYHHQPDASGNQKVKDTTDRTTDDNQLVNSSLPAPGKKQKYALEPHQLSTEMTAFLKQVLEFFTKPMNLQRMSSAVGTSTMAKVFERIRGKYQNFYKLALFATHKRALYSYFI